MLDWTGSGPGLDAATTRAGASARGPNYSPALWLAAAQSQQTQMAEHMTRMRPLRHRSALQ